MNDAGVAQPVGEVKLLTILFADLAGSTALCEGLTPDQVHELINAWVKLITAEIYRQGGIVTEFAGDAVMAIFGAPVAYEDAPQRACLAGLAMQRALREFNQQRQVPLQMRIGIDTGESFVGAVGSELRSEYTALGHRANLAKRVQEVAERGSVTVSQETYERIAPYFQTVEAGEFPAKGLSHPLRVYRVLGPAAAKSRLEVTMARWRSGLIGRAVQLDQLAACLDRALGGSLQYVLVEGEPGIGKSRLAHELKLRAESRNALWWEARAQPYAESQAYAIIADTIRRAIGATAVDSDDMLRFRLRERFASLGADVIFLEALLALEDSETALRHLDPEARKHGTFATVRDLVRHTVQAAPLVWVLDDVHWADKISVELIGFVVESLPDAALMLCLLSRPEGPPLPHPERLARIPVSVLSREETARLVGALLDLTDHPALPGLAGRVHRISGGNPLFIEEVLHAFVSAGVLIFDGKRWQIAGEVAGANVPSSLHDLIAARIDRLDDAAKETLLHAAVIGDEFSTRVLREVLDGKDVAGPLELLSELDFIERRDSEPEFAFKHGLTWQVAYRTLPRRVRAPLHERVGAAIERLFSADIDRHVTALAYHYAASPNAAKAVEYLRRAGTMAERSFANEMAARYYTQALERVGGSMPADEFELRVQRGTLASQFLGDYAGAIADFDAAASVARQLHDSAREAQALLGKANTYANQSRWDEALQWFDRVLDASGEASPEALEALVRKGFVLNEKGETDAAEQALGRALEQCRLRNNDYWEIQALIYLARLQYRRVQIDEALQTYATCITRCREVGDKALLSLALQNQITAYAVGFHGIEDYKKAIEVTVDLQELLNEIGDKRRLANSYFNVAIAWQALGQERIALQNYEEALRRYDDLGIQFWAKRALMVLRLLYPAVGESGKHAAVLERLAAMAEAEGDRREVTELLAELGDVSAARAELDRARRAWFAAARSAIEMEDVDAAIQCLERIKKIR